jgi:hypothetical protein
MKKSILIIPALLLSLMFTPYHSIAAGEKSPVMQESGTPPESEQAKVLLLRLNEISEMPKAGLNFTERVELRREVKTIKQQLSEMDGGVYISVGAAIVILLLLIILL